MEDYVKCVDHITEEELWKARAAAKVLEIGRINSMNDITEQVRRNILSKLRIKRQLTENVFMECVKDEILIRIAGSPGAYTFCLNTGTAIKVDSRSLYDIIINTSNQNVFVHISFKQVAD